MVELRRYWARPVNSGVVNGIVIEWLPFRRFLRIAYCVLLCLKACLAFFRFNFRLSRRKARCKCMLKPYIVSAQHMYLIGLHQGTG